MPKFLSAPFDMIFDSAGNFSDEGSEVVPKFLSAPFDMIFDSAGKFSDEGR